MAITQGIDAAWMQNTGMKQDRTLRMSVKEWALSEDGWLTI